MRRSKYKSVFCMGAFTGLNIWMFLRDWILEGQCVGFEEELGQSQYLKWFEYFDIWRRQAIVPKFSQELLAFCLESAMNLPPFLLKGKQTTFTGLPLLIICSLLGGWNARINVLDLKRLETEKYCKHSYGSQCLNFFKRSNLEKTVESKQYRLSYSVVHVNVPGSNGKRQ